MRSFCRPSHNLECGKCAVFSFQTPAQYCRFLWIGNSGTCTCDTGAWSPTDPLMCPAAGLQFGAGGPKLIAYPERKGDPRLCRYLEGDSTTAGRPQRARREGEVWLKCFGGRWESSESQHCAVHSMVHYPVPGRRASLLEIAQRSMQTEARPGE